MSLLDILAGSFRDVDFGKALQVSFDRQRLRDHAALYSEAHPEGRAILEHFSPLSDAEVSGLRDRWNAMERKS